jgi:hypothetical protein
MSADAAVLTTSEANEMDLPCSFFGTSTTGGDAAANVTIELVISADLISTLFAGAEEVGADSLDSLGAAD